MNTKTNIKHRTFNFQRLTAAALMATALLIANSQYSIAEAQLSTNTPATPTSQSSFFNQAFNWFTAADPALDGIFTNGSALLWAGVDSVQGGNATLVNEIGISYGVIKPQRLSLEAVTRNGGMTGTVMSQQLGVSLNFNLRDMRIAVYADGGYYLADSEITPGPSGKISTSDRMYGEIGIRAFKALGQNTYAYVSLGAQFPTSRQVYGAGVGIRF
jgi:hypothetical protein